ncbi:MAG: hypothetical protein RRY29_08940 [Desulfovibrionaceae bacterium]
MAENKKISIILMRDDGQTHRYRLSMTLYRVLWVLSIVIPLLAGGAVWLSYHLWEENVRLVTNSSRLELAMHEAQHTAEKLSNLQTLLDQEDSAVTGPVLQNLARQSSQEAPQDKPKAPNDEADSADSGPGHADFPVVDTKVVNIENVNARLLSSGKIRISLDLRNPDSKHNIIGHVKCLFIADSGETFPLSTTSEQADFKINRFKRAVFQPPVPSAVTDTTNARMILEVYTEGTTLIYRNIFPIER